MSRKRKKQRSPSPLPPPSKSTSHAHYTGSRDPQGRPHGRGSLTEPAPALEDEEETAVNVFEGRFHHGVPHGLGHWHFADGASLAGQFAYGELNGRGVYTDSDGTTINGHYVNTVLMRGSEYDATGALRYRGEYGADNQWHGSGTFYDEFGGAWTGQWREGKFHGADNTFSHPVVDGRLFQYRGQWDSGDLIDAQCLLDGVPLSDTRYSQCESQLGETHLHEPLLPDPYEQHCTHVAQSTEPDAGEGLFASVTLPPNTVVSFYNGIKQLASLTESNDWSLNANAIALDEDEGIDIDVPAFYASTQHYRASLGHKCNHSHDPIKRNARYSLCLHPRFGLIKSIRTLERAVAAGTELLVDYDYNHEDYPEWWDCSKTPGEPQSSDV